MQFVIPEASALHKGIILIAAPRHILLLKQMPLICPLLWRQLGMSIAYMLKFINRHAERYECQCLLKMRKSEFVCLLTEEPLGIRISNCSMDMEWISAMSVDSL